MKPGWGRYALYSGLVLLVGGFLYALVGAVITNNTGFETKTLWDWMELLIVPSVLAGGAFFLNRSERNTEREIANERQQDLALQTYIDRMSELLLKEKLRTTRKTEVHNVARTRTLSIMRLLDTKRNNIVVQFLREAELITDNKSIFIEASMQEMNLGYLNLHFTKIQGAQLGNADLHGVQLEDADLQDANLFHVNFQNARLSGANLQDTNLQSANLQSANLSGANLQGAFLADANLQGAQLRRAKLQGAYLNNANLQGVKNLTEEQLASVKSLRGATMPDGTRHG